MTEHEVVIAGGGPTGLMLAGELALAEIDVVIVERRTDQHVDGSRAGGLHAPTIESVEVDRRGDVRRGDGGRAGRLTLLFDRQLADLGHRAAAVVRRCAVAR